MISSGQIFIFGPDVRSYFVSIGIVDDDAYETKSEDFVIALSTNATELRGLRLGIASLTIKDDDSKLCIQMLLILLKALITQ